MHSSYGGFGVNQSRDDPTVAKMKLDAQKRQIYMLQPNK